jgi:hypothetical protein
VPSNPDATDRVLPLTPLRVTRRRQPIRPKLDNADAGASLLLSGERRGAATAGVGLSDVLSVTRVRRMGVALTRGCVVRVKAPRSRLVDRASAWA